MPQLTELELLQHIDPAQLDYQDWVNVGMALKDAGYTASDWDRWSQRDAGRYHQGECFRKWGASGLSQPRDSRNLSSPSKRPGLGTGQI